MGILSSRRRALTAGQRGLLIQRVIVEGWTPAEAARAFAVEEGQVAAWVASYRRRGMASLRRDRAGGGAAELMPSRVARRAAAVLAAFRARLRRLLAQAGAGSRQPPDQSQPRQRK